jgi:hypothetical protein
MVESAPPVGGAGTSVLHAVVASGPQAGTYDSSGPKVDCNLSSSASGATGGDITATKGVGSYVFSAIGGGTNPSTFYFQLLFAPIALNPPEILIDTLTPTSADGSGTASLTDTGATIKWSIDGKTKDNVAVTATIECGPVDRPA